MLSPCSSQRYFGLLVVVGILVGVFFELAERCSPPPNAAPKLIKESVTFSYPLQAYDQKIEGTVVLRLFIDEEGQVQKARIWRSSGYAILDSSALAVAHTARFKPGRLNGKTQGMWLTWPLVYTFDSIAEDMEKWKEKVKEAQYRAIRAKPPDQEAAQYQVLVYYRGMAHKMVNDREPTLNATIFSVLAPEVRRQWERYEHLWPLSFILFQDFLHRYPNSAQNKTAREYLIDYLKFEISLLQYTTPPENDRERRMQQELLQELRQFLQTQLPEASS